MDTGDQEAGQPVDPAAVDPTPVFVAPQRPRRRRTGINPRRRGLLTGAATLLVLLVAVVAWIGIRGLLARRALEAARTAVVASETSYRRGLTTPGALQAGKAAEQADRARHLTDDPVWHLAGHLPVVGSALRSTAGLAAAVHDLAGTGLPAAGAAAVDVGGQHLRTPAGGVDLDRLAAATASLGIAQQSLDRTAAAVGALPAQTVVGAIDRARATLLTTVTDVQRQVGQVVAAARLARPMLGADGPRTYFLALQNPAEVRGTGGLVGSYAIVRADKGVLSLVQAGSDSDLKNDPGKPTFTLGAEFDGQWGAFQPTSIWQQSNFSPVFSDAATIWLSLWQRQTGQTLDGAIAIDPEVAGAVLAATGATVPLPDGTVLAGGQVQKYTESTIYAKYATDNSGRKAQLTALTQAVFDQLKAGANAEALLKAVATGVGQGRVLVASRHPEEQSQLLATTVGGSLPADPGPFAHAVVNNTGGNKVDYYLDRTVDYRGGACTGTTRSSTVTITLHNGAPTSGLTPYVAGSPLGVPGLSRTYLTVYTALGSQLAGATLDGAPLATVPYVADGRPSFAALLDIKPGATATVVLHLSEPAGLAPVTDVQQPLPRSGDSSVVFAPCAQVRP